MEKLLVLVSILFYLLTSVSPSKSSSDVSTTALKIPLSFLQLDQSMKTTQSKSSSTIHNQGQNRFFNPNESIDDEKQSNDRGRGKSLNNVESRRHRPHRRNFGNKPVNPSLRSKTRLHHVCPQLDGVVGAPTLPVLITKDPRTIQRWVEENVYNDDSEYVFLGFDQESISKPPWMPQRASLPDGPATIQLSTPQSCLIIQLSRCGDGSALYAPSILRSIINNPKIIKVGVGIDDDALELYRWSKTSPLGTRTDSNHGRNSQRASALFEMTSRFDIGCILPQKNPSRRSGIRELAQAILGVEINKSKKLSMSNWGNRHLTPEQITYAARDAWVSAAIIERLQTKNPDTLRAESIMSMDFMKSQRNMADLDYRASQRKKAKLELKALLEENITKEEDDNINERKRVLHNILDLYRPTSMQR